MMSIKVKKTYKIHSLFKTIQGEGLHHGRAAVFIRFSGCNVWSGIYKDRERDSSVGFCAKICDTVFAGVDKDNGGGVYTCVELVAAVKEAWGVEGGGFVVLTGGEPALQITAELLMELHDALFFIAVETNGSVGLPKGCDHVCLSPKPPMDVVDQRYNEVKILYPEVNPLDYERFAPIRWVTPVWPPPTLGFLSPDYGPCLKFVCEHPRWAISVQMHKYIGVE